MGEKVGELGENTNVFWGGMVVGGVEVGCVGVKIGESGESTQRFWGDVFVVVGVSACGGGVSIEIGSGAASAHCTPSSSSEGDGGVQAAAQRSSRN